MGGPLERRIRTQSQLLLLAVEALHAGEVEARELRQHRRRVGGHAAEPAADGDLEGRARGSRPSSETSTTAARTSSGRRFYAAGRMPAPNE
jgi:hypothetical protein